MRIQSILVATDFSECSAAAETYAAELAGTLGAKLRVVHIFNPLVYVMPETIMLTHPDWVDETRRSLEASLKNTVTRLQALPGAPKAIDSKVVNGVPHQALCEEATRDGHDLLIIGTHGRSGLAHMFIGSVAERVVRHAPIPVLTVRTPTKK